MMVSSDRIISARMLSISAKTGNEVWSPRHSATNLDVDGERIRSLDRTRAAKLIASLMTNGFNAHRFIAVK